MYFEFLLKNADSSDVIDEELLNRIERLVGFADNSNRN
jgi:hypothetical protein